MVYAYLRVSSATQDEQNQRLGVESKAQQLNLRIDKFVVDKISGTIEPNNRNLGKLLKKVKSGDIIIISELSRFGRRLFMLFRILESLLQRGAMVYSVKDGYSLDNSLQSKVLAFAFGMAAEIERDMISMRTREALALRKAQGIHLGRPRGYVLKTHKLDSLKDKILQWYGAGISKTQIARRCHCTHKTVRKYINLWQPKGNTNESIRI